MERSRYETEQKRIWNEILSDLEAGGSKVIDVGIGESTKKLAEAGADVIGVDCEMKKPKECEMDLPLVKCDIANFPFEKQIADLTVFCFTLHEINPRKHAEAVHIASVISPRLAVIEPSPEGGPIYQRYRNVWQKAMESIGKYEEYRPFSYWKDLVKREGFAITTSRKIKQQANIPSSVLENIVQDAITDMEEWGVQAQYIQDMKELLDDAREQGMRWSPLLVVIGKHQ